MTSAGGVPQGVGFLVGPHDLVVSYGDCEFTGHCSCGHYLTTIRPDQELNVFGTRWERHVRRDHKNCDCEPCSW